MPLISIIGTSGSGKSTVLEHLISRGFEAYGVDEEGLADWVDRDTGAVILFPHDDPNLDFHDWYARHRWVSSPKRISELKEKADAANRVIFLAGMAEDEDKVRHLFDTVIYMAVDEKTIEDRFKNRAEGDNKFGQTPEEMDIIRGWLRDNDEKYKKSGVQVIDATRSINKVVDAVIKAAQEREKA